MTVNGIENMDIKTWSQKSSGRLFFCNIAKEMHVGHLRSVIGGVIAQMCWRAGYIG